MEMMRIILMTMELNCFTSVVCVQQTLPITSVITQLTSVLGQNGICNFEFLWNEETLWLLADIPFWRKIIHSFTHIVTVFILLYLYYLVFPRIAMLTL